MRSLFPALRKLVFVISILTLFAQQADAQFVTIPDTAFANWLANNGFASCMNGNQLDTACTKVINADSLQPSGVPIRDLTGIQYFKSLEVLNCANDLLVFIPSLPPSLRLFTCSANLLDSLPVLPITLTALICNNNAISSLPYLPASLNYLECCSDSLLKQIPALPVTLESLFCNFDYRLDSLPSLPVSLNQLNCDNNNFTHLPALPVNMSYLSCAYNQLTTLPPLPVSLQSLSCQYNQLTALPSTLPLVLNELWCSNNQLTSIPELPASLQWFNCQYNFITQLPALPPNLETLVCRYNALTSLPELPSYLFDLFCSNNPNLTCLPQLKRINNFEFDSTGIICLPNYGNVINSSPRLDLFPLCSANNANGCATYTGINGVADISKLSIYPNPTSGKLEIELQNIGGNLLQISIMDISGQVLRRENINARVNTELDVSALPAGLYFLSADGGGGKWVKKFVKE